MNDEIPEQAHTSSPPQIADLRAVSLTDLAADRDGSVAVLRAQILDGGERLRVAAFSSFI
jgi:hypothetical protein